MNRFRSVPAVACLLAAAAALGGCANADPTRGYTLRSQYRQGIETIAVPIWRRAAGEYRRGIEIRLTESLVKRIESETPYKVVDRKAADTLLEGTLRSVRQHVLSFDPRSGRAREVQARFLVDFTWKDLRTGKVLVARKRFPVTAEYIPEAPFGEDFFLGSEDALNKLAQRIVEQLTEPW